MRSRIRHGLRRPGNWIQLAQFAAVGASGYAVNLLVFAECELATDYRVAAVVAWMTSVLSNFWLNRRWTFRHTHAQPLAQYGRFFVVSALAFGLTFLVLIVLVTSAHVVTMVAQAIAIGVATPLNFGGQKLWTFGSNRRART